MQQIMSAAQKLDHGPRARWTDVVVVVTLIILHAGAAMRLERGIDDTSYILQQYLLRGIRTDDIEAHGRAQH